jgi:hypothetical protein
VGVSRPVSNIVMYGGQCIARCHTSAVTFFTTRSTPNF